MVETFHIVPASPRSLVAVAVLIGIVSLLGLGVLAATIHGSRASRFELSPDGLRVRGDLYGRLVPAHELRGAAARAVDLTTDTSLRPAWRTMGTSVGGYRSGWFRLANGEKALVYVTDGRRAVYVPTTAGYVLLLSVAEHERFLARVREIAPRG